MKLRRLFGIGALIGMEKRAAWLATAVPIFFTRERTVTESDLAENINVHEERIGGGSIFNLRYRPTKHWWIEGSTAILKEHARAKGTHNYSESRTGFDDFVYAFGRHWFPTENIQLVIYGIGGIPLHRDVTQAEIFETLVGTRFYSLGFGWELSFSPINNHERWLILLFQNRFLHFFNRAFDPILPVDAEIQPGNVTDILCTINYREKKNIYEIGYNPTFFTHRGIVMSDRDIEGKNFVRQSFYLSYDRIITSFPLVHKPVIIGVGLNYARAERDDIKNFSCWFNITVLF